jgi:hypothetical protein
MKGDSLRQSDITQCDGMAQASTAVPGYENIADREILRIKALEIR